MCTYLYSFFISINDNSYFNTWITIITILGVGNITSFITAFKFYKDRKKAGRSNIALARENEEKTRQIRKYEQLLAKTNSDVEEVINCLPTTNDGLHHLFHELGEGSRFSEEIKRETDRNTNQHLKDYAGEPLIRKFFLGCAALVARKLITEEKYTCARGTVTYNMFNKYMMYFGTKLQESTEMYSTNIEEDNVLRDLDEIILLKKICGKFDDHMSLDRLIACEIFIAQHGDVPLNIEQKKKLNAGAKAELTGGFAKMPNSYTLLALNAENMGKSAEEAGWSQQIKHEMSECELLHLALRGAVERLL